MMTHSVSLTEGRLDDTSFLIEFSWGRPNKSTQYEIISGIVRLVGCTPLECLLDGGGSRGIRETRED